MREFGCVNFTFTRISPNVLNHVATSNLYIICTHLLDLTLGEDSRTKAHDGTKLQAKHRKNR